MRQLSHPSAAAITVEGILHALADPVRASIFARIAASAEPHACNAFVQCAQWGTLPKSTLSQHFRVLREAGLIRSERQGVTLLNTSRCAEVDQRFPGLLAAITAAWRSQNSAPGRTARVALSLAASRNSRKR